MTAFKIARRTMILTTSMLGLALAQGAAISGPISRNGRDNLAPAGGAQVANPASHPQSTLSPQERADIYMARKSYADAVDFYNRALKEPGISPADSATIWNKLGIAFQQQVNFGAARKAYAMAIHLHGDFSEPWNNLGTTFFLENKFKKSLKYYRRALKLNPDSASFHMNYGTAFYRMKKFKEAVDEYRAALTLDPSILYDRATNGTVMETRGADANFYFYLAKTFAILGRPDEAVRYLRRAMEEGFKDHRRLKEDPDIKKISEYPAYVELMKNPPVSIKE
ncbi:MAG TPA: tetratricopeptide repeat protein [Terriglobia bacterium]|nr:tetratricopeptide repeat protein [Terriglobia bacterium]